MEVPNNENTLYLPIKQDYFDLIVVGSIMIERWEVRKVATVSLLHLPYSF